MSDDVAKLKAELDVAYDRMEKMLIAIKDGTPFLLYKWFDSEGKAIRGGKDE